MTLHICKFLSASGSFSVITVWFSLFDQDGDGKLSEDELRRVMVSIGEFVIPEPEFNQLLQVHRDPDCYANLRQFSRLLCRFWSFAILKLSSIITRQLAIFGPLWRPLFLFFSSFIKDKFAMRNMLKFSKLVVLETTSFAN